VKIVFCVLSSDGMKDIILSEVLKRNLHNSGLAP